MPLTISIRGDGLPRLEEAAKALGSEAKAKRAYRRAINEAGRDTTAPTYRALAQQTGLKPSVTRRALRVKKASTSNLSFTLTGRGGDVSLKWFGARETRRGVSAAPFGKRQIFEGRFIKGGLFPNRKTLPFEGNVFNPKRGSRRWGRPFSKQKSGVIIPIEMVKGITAETFQRIGSTKLTEKVHRHIILVSKGVLT